MKMPSLKIVSFAAIGLAVLALVVAGVLYTRRAPPSASPGVTANGFTLTSTAVTLPIDAATYPDGPNAAIVNANCASCHSPSMVLSQPALTADQWKATVTKMREVYKAPVAEKDVPAILDYLTHMRGQAGGKPL